MYIIFIDPQQRPSEDAISAHEKVEPAPENEVGQAAGERFLAVSLVPRNQHLEKNINLEGTHKEKIISAVATAPSPRTTLLHLQTLTTTGLLLLREAPTSTAAAAEQLLGAASTLSLSLSAIEENIYPGDDPPSQTLHIYHLRRQTTCSHQKSTYYVHISDISNSIIIAQRY